MQRSAACIFTNVNVFWQFKLIPKLLIDSPNEFRLRKSVPCVDFSVTSWSNWLPFSALLLEIAARNNVIDWEQYNDADEAAEWKDRQFIIDFPTMARRRNPAIWLYELTRDFLP